MKDFDYYQAQAKRYATFKDPHYPLLAVGEEVGELQGLFAKQLRKYGNLEGICKATASSEIGDVLWNLALIADMLGIKLGDCAGGNLIKLHERMEQGTLDAIKRETS